MSWKSLTERLDTLPLILAGPIVRRVEPGSVTVWLALKEPRLVTLQIYRQDDAGKLSQQFAGVRRTIRLGDHLHMVAVTAQPGEGEAALAWGGSYYYNLLFQGDEREPTGDLSTPGILNNDPDVADEVARLVYTSQRLPGFVLPPEDLNQVRILHGSCRKPHGTGKEMLSGVDHILETALQEHGQRPQQLFLTGDQIYADDVATPMLFMLIDAGTCLFEGNEEERLPLVDEPAQALAPGTRRQAVRRQALFTTTTPDNHLLSLAEYVGMYLFCWSDVLWPDEFPEASELWQRYPETRPEAQQEEQEGAKYEEQLERLMSFREMLPRVRRALANIATYMICDDHDVTDDWFLDGAWCQRVLANVLGRHIVRNAMLAFVLCQAWGNTPAQFASARGTALLEAIDMWRGGSTEAQVEIIRRGINLPMQFGGRGELSTSHHALRWHYTFVGPRYQMIVMDTRTHRLYPRPEAFPGLLSPNAIEQQIVEASRPEAEVTLIVSATPVLGVEAIEAIQFWSHVRVKDNYAYDCESWALDWSTFQRFLRAVSRMRRVVFLSGDVHYGFGSSLDYWDHSSGQTAKIIDFTSSPLSNEGSSLQMAMLSVGYPYLMRLLKRQDMPEANFFAWDIVSGKRQVFDILNQVLRSRLYRFWWAIPRLIRLSRNRHEIILPAHDWPAKAFNRCPPDRMYRLRYLRNKHSPLAQQAFVATRWQGLRASGAQWFAKIARTLLRGVIFLQGELGKVRSKLLRRQFAPESLPRGTHHIVHQAIKGTYPLERNLEKSKTRLAKQISRREIWLQKWKSGAYIVGYANLGDIRFRWTEAERCATQYLWWWHPDDQQYPTIGSEYEETLNLPDLSEAPQLP